MAMLNNQMVILKSFRINGTIYSPAKNCPFFQRASKIDHVNIGDFLAEP